MQPSTPDRIRSVWQSGMSVSDIANAIGSTKGVVSGHYTRNSGLRRSCPLAPASKPPTNATRPASFDAKLLTYMPAIRKRAWGFRNMYDSADDLAQDTIAEAMRTWHNYDSKNDFHGWLLLVMKNVLSVSYRKRRHDVSATPETTTAPSQEWCADLSAAVGIINGLPGGDELLEIAAGATMQEIGERTGVSRQRVEQRVKRVRERLVMATTAPEAKQCA